ISGSAASWLNLLLPPPITHTKMASLSCHDMQFFCGPIRGCVMTDQGSESINEPGGERVQDLFDKTVALPSRSSMMKSWETSSRSPASPTTNDSWRDSRKSQSKREFDQSPSGWTPGVRRRGITKPLWAA